jgi:solute carrier family 35 protein F5
MPRLGKWSLGVLCIIIVAFIWNASSVLVQFLYKDFNFPRPFFLTWVANSLFMILLPLRMIIASVKHQWSDRSTAAEVHTCAFENSNDAAAEADDTEGDQVKPLQQLQPKQQQDPVRQAARSGLLVAPIWFGANCAYNWSMSLTSISSSTIISQATSAGFTLFLSAVWLGENLTRLKVLGVALCTFGNALAVVSDGGSGSDSNGTDTHNHSAHNGTQPSDGVPPTFWGDLICFLGALLYGCYTVLIRRLDPPDLGLFFGFLGLGVFLLFGPIVVALHVTGVEDLSTITPQITALLIGKGLLDNVLSDYLWAIAVLLTSPSVATIGMSLTVPLAIASDGLLPKQWLEYPQRPTPLSVLSAVAVVFGFVAINFASSDGLPEGGEASARDCRGCLGRVGMRAPLLGVASGGDGAHHSEGHHRPIAPRADVAVSGATSTSTSAVNVEPVQPEGATAPMES